MKRKKKRVMQTFKAYTEKVADKALEQGLEKGFEKGREQGGEKRSREIALNLLRNGSESKFVAKNTGLSLKEVQALQKGIKK